MKKNAARNGGLASASEALTGAPAAIDSNHGTDIAAPTPRNSVLRVKVVDFRIYFADSPCPTAYHFSPNSRRGAFFVGPCDDCNASAPPCVFRKGTLSTTSRTN